MKLALLLGALFQKLLKFRQAIHFLRVALPVDRAVVLVEAVLALRKSDQRLNFSYKKSNIQRGMLDFCC